MKPFLTIVILLLCKTSVACDCNPANPILEFYNAEYVFEGEIVSKVYADDAQTYIITFSILKHYKDGEKPEELNFTIISEEFYTGKSTSCDWSVKEGEKWLVYAHLTDKGILVFDGICSNSKRIDFNKIGAKEQKILDVGNSYIIGNYAYYLEPGFNHTMPVTDVESIVKQAKTKFDKSYFTVVIAYIDKRGNLKNVLSSKHYPITRDTIFNLPIAFKKNLENRILNPFDEEAIKAAKEIKKWEIKYHTKTKIPVEQIRNIIFQYDKKTNTWSYEL